MVCKPFFFFVFRTQTEGWAPRLFLEATVETGNKNRDDFQCMQSETCDELVSYLLRLIQSCPKVIC